MLIYIICLIIFAIVYFCEYKEKQQNQMKPVNWLLNTGIMLIILSSVILLTSSWKFLSDSIKVLILFAGSFIYTGAGIYLKRKQNLEKTGNALTLLGTFVFSISTLSLSYYEILGEKFILTGEYKFLMIGIATLIETILLIIRDKVLKKDNYTLSLLMFLGTIFTFTHQIFNNTLISLLGIAFTLLFINIMKKILVKNDRNLKIINFVFITIMLTLFPLIGININNHYKYISVIGYIIFTILIPLNYYLQIKDTEIKFTTPIIETILLIYSLSVLKNYAVCGSLLLLSSIFIMIMSIKVKEKLMKKSLFFNYIFQSTLASIIFVMQQKYSFATIIITLINIFILYNYKNNNKIVNIIKGILDPTNIFLLLLSILRATTIIKELNFYNLTIVLMTTFMSVIIYYEITHKKYFKIYDYLLLVILLFINKQGYVPTYYKIMLTIIDFALLINNNICKKVFENNTTIITTLVAIFNVGLLYTDNLYLGSLLIALQLIISYAMNRKNKDKFYYLAMLYIPYVLAVNKLTNSNNLIHSSIIISLLLFTRCYLTNLNKNDKFTIEVIIIGIIGLTIESPLEMLVYLAILLIFNRLLLSKESDTASKYSIMITTAITYYSIKVLGMQDKFVESVGLIIMMIINQLENSINETKYTQKLGIANSIILMIMSYLIIDKLVLGPIVGALVLELIIFMMRYLYLDNRNKTIIKMYRIIPIYYFLRIVTNDYAKEIIGLFILLYPLSLACRKIFVLKEKNINLAEALVIGVMILQYVFIIDITVAITLGVILLIITTIGFMCDYKSYSNLGLAGIILVVIVQTINLWNKMPWWLYLFIVGICLIVVSVIIEKRKNKEKLNVNEKKESNN